MKKLAALFCLLFSCVAYAQQPIVQSGFATPGHALYFLTNGVAADAGTAAQGFLTSIGVTAQGPGICQNSAPITQSYNQICLIANSTGNAGISFFNHGTTAAFTISVNGVVYQFPFTGSGAIGPPSTVVGDFSCWNNTVGTLLSDCKLGPPSTTVGDFSCWNNTVGTLLSDCKLGPPSTTVGDFSCWNNTVGTLLSDCQVPTSLATVSVTTTKTMGTSDCGKVQILNSTTQYTVTFPAASTLSSNCYIQVINNDTAGPSGKMIVIPGISTGFILYPTQQFTVANASNVWTYVQWPTRWKNPQGNQINFYTNYNSGSDTANDGLSAARPFKTVNHGLYTGLGQVDCNGGEAETQILVNMAAATNDLDGLHVAFHDLVGCQGGATVQVLGATLPISNVTNDGTGRCLLTIPSNSTYINSEIVSVWGIGGATGCNGTWQVGTVSSTQLALLHTTFGGSYSGGGTISNGSTFQVTGNADVSCYFSTEFQISAVGFTIDTGQAGLAANQGCNVYLLQGNYFNGGANGIFAISNGQVHLDGDIGYYGNFSSAFVQAQIGGRFYSDGTNNLWIVPGGAATTTGSLGFAYADTNSTTSFQGITIQANGVSLTGLRCSATLNGVVNSGTGTPNSYFPGNSNCTTASGGQAE